VLLNHALRKSGTIWQSIRWFLAVLLLCLGVTAVLLGTGAVSAQSAAQRWEVQVSGADPTGTFMAQGFYPGPLVIRAGDTVTWRWAMSPAPHTVTFNAGRPPLADIMPGPGPGELMLGPASFPTGPTGPNATFDGSVQASSGIPGDPDATYSLTFTRPGLYGYVCALHPGMRAEIEVREAGASLPETPAQARARGQATIGALIDKMKTDVAMFRPASGAGIHTAVAGLGNGFGASYIQFLPGDVTVRRGDTVVWTMPDPFEIHTVTFLSGAAPPDFIEPRPQPSGPPQLVIPSSIVAPSGGSTYTGQGIVNSGILGNGASFILRFDASPGAYEYVCLIHPTMRATVTVTG
jgi:plastocyanin